AADVRRLLHAGPALGRAPDEPHRKPDQPIHPRWAADPGRSGARRRSHAVPHGAHELLPVRDGASTAEAGRVRRFRDWWANPWGRPRFLVLFTALYLVWSIVPILIAIRFSFNEGRSRSTAQGWSLRWYTGDPDASVLHDPTLHSALAQSLRLAAIAVLVTVPLGVALAVGLTRW